MNHPSTGRRHEAIRILLVGAAAIALCFALPDEGLAQSGTLRFPADDGIHRGASFEMWSTFAHVKSARGDTYSAIAFFFTGKILGLSLSGVYGAVLDTRTGAFVDDRDLVTPIFGSKRHSTGRLDERYSRSTLSRDSTGAYDISLATGPLQLGLSLMPVRAAVDLGRIVVGAGRTQRSYVVPRANVRGRLRDASGTMVAVQGIGLFQHVWGDSPEQSAAEDVLAIHLDDGTDLFALSGPVPESAVVMVSKDAASRVLRDGFRLESDSLVVAGPVSFRRRWHLRVDSPVLDLRVTPTSETRHVKLLGIPYLIVRCVISGTGPDGRPVLGVAYMYVRGREAAGDVRVGDTIRR